MTRDEARRRAVEAAADEAGIVFYQAMNGNATLRQADALVLALLAYERAMADAGWRMVRDVGERSVGKEEMGDPYDRCEDAGWNACRRAMLGGEP